MIFSLSIPLIHVVKILFYIATVLMTRGTLCFLFKRDNAIVPIIETLGLGLSFKW